MSPDLHALSGAYALDALDADERATFEEHLAECPDCEEEVRSLRDAAAELSHVSAVAPPAQLRTDVLNAIQQVRPLAPVTDNVIALRRARAGRSIWQAMAAACALIALLAGGWGYQQHQAAGNRNSADRAISSVLAATDASAVTGQVGSGHATLVYSKGENKLVLVGHGIPALDKSKTYQLWMIAPDGKSYTSAALFRPDSKGNVTAEAAGDLAATGRMGVSVEPAGGSAQPTDVIATMSI
jgi:anti-sigma-K factor RskA